MEFSFLDNKTSKRFYIFIFLVLEYQRWYWATIFSVNLCNNLRSNIPLPSSSSCFASFWLKRVLCRCPPYILSMHSLTAWYVYPECPSPSTDFRASPQIYWRNCKGLYPAVGGARSIQAVNADFQFSYCRLSPSKLGIETRLSYLQRSFLILSLSFSNSMLLPYYFFSILPISPGSSMLSIFAVLSVSQLFYMLFCKQHFFSTQPQFCLTFHELSFKYCLGVAKDI